MSVPETIPLKRIQKHSNNDLFSNVFPRIKSDKSALWMKEVVDREPAVTPTYDNSKKNVCYLEAQQNLEITQNNTK